MRKRKCGETSIACERQLNSLLRGLAVGFRHGDELEQRCGFGLGDRPAPGMMRQVGDDLLDADRSGIRIADEDLRTARRRRLGSVGSDERDGIDELVLLAIVGVFGGEALDEIVVDEGGAEDVIAFREERGASALRSRDRSRPAWRAWSRQAWSCSSLPSIQKASITGLASGARSPWQPEADDVFAIELDAAAWPRWC